MSTVDEIPFNEKFLYSCIVFVGYSSPNECDELNVHIIIFQEIDLQALFSLQEYFCFRKRELNQFTAPTPKVIRLLILASAVKREF
jgi:hypothetical protein